VWYESPTLYVWVRGEITRFGHWSHNTQSCQERDSGNIRNRTVCPQEVLSALTLILWGRIRAAPCA
jgi:hypothetical protein